MDDQQSESEKALAAGLAAAPKPTHDPTTCNHPNFAAGVSVGRFLDSGKFMCEVRIVCVQCREPFRFRGVPPGISWDHPTCSIDGLELNCPVEPEQEKRLFSGATYQMPVIPPRH